MVRWKISLPPDLFLFLSITLFSSGHWICLLGLEVPEVSTLRSVVFLLILPDAVHPGLDQRSFFSPSGLLHRFRRRLTFLRSPIRSSGSRHSLEFLDDYPVFAAIEIIFRGFSLFSCSVIFRDSFAFVRDENFHRRHTSPCRVFRIHLKENHSRRQTLNNFFL